MRKVSSFLTLPVISREDKGIIGTITGVFCEKRLKSVEFFIVENENNIRFFIPPRSAKLNNNESVILSKNLCIKNEQDIMIKDIVALPFGQQILSWDGSILGSVEDLLFDDKTKTASSIIANGKEINVSSVASVNENGVLLLPDGRKRVRKPKQNINPKEIKVQIFDENRYLPVRQVSSYNFLIGRVVTKNIYNFSHELIIPVGTLIKADTVLLAHKNNKLINLTLYSKS